jgi:cold shock CspA family protein
MERMTGTITKVRLNKGYAFVRGADDGLPRFVYARDVVPVSAFDMLYEGRKVTFEPWGTIDMRPEAPNNGLRALKVEIC